MTKSFAEFSAEAENKLKIIFCRGVYLAENTSQAASVRVVRQQMRGPHKARMRFMGRGETRTQVEFPVNRKRHIVFGVSTKCAQQTAKKLAEKPEGVFRQAQNRHNQSHAGFKITIVQP